MLPKFVSSIGYYLGRSTRAQVDSGDYSLSVQHPGYGAG